MRKWRWVETMFIELAEGLEEFLDEHSIKKEVSACGSGWHFEILCNEEEAKLINSWLDGQNI